MNLIRGFNTLNPAQRIFFVSANISSLYTIYLLFNYVPESIWSIIFSSVTLLSSYIYISYFVNNPNKWRVGEILLLFLTFITVFHLPSHFLATSRFIIKKELKDDTLIKIDKILLGWLIKDGQVSLYIDQNNFIGPHTIFGKFLNNSLQIFYFLYYIIPYISMHFMSLINCGKEIIFRFQNKGKKSCSYIHTWSNTLFIFGSYLLTCVFIFFINSLVPASSPRKYLAEKFVHPLNLSGLGKYLNKKCKDDKSANSFPSGHVAEILNIGLSYIIIKNYIVGIIIIFSSFLIAMATLFLRYHYFCDIIAAIICSLLGVFFNYYFGYKKYLNNLEKKRRNFEIKNIGNSPGIINVNINMDSSQKNNEVKIDEEKDKNHIQFVEENAN